MNHILNDETGKITIEIKTPLLLVDGKSYLDFSSLAELTELNHSKLYRMLKSMKDLNTYKVNYKNRIYFQDIILLYFRTQ
jgi:hypothetical protein